jgi:Fur family ferric uptake transcriptional regulator
VIAALAGVDDFRSANEFHELLRGQGHSVGLSTVYRTLQALADAGEIDAIVRDDGETAYRRCSEHHHHHLVCRSCGGTVEVSAPALERWTNQIAGEHGYSEVTHTLEIHGRCQRCSSRESTA